VGPYADHRAGRDCGRGRMVAPEPADREQGDDGRSRTSSHGGAQEAALGSHPDRFSGSGN